jgi:integrase
LREQLDRLVEAIDPRYRALVLVAALTGKRWGELVALRWDDPRFDQPLDDGAVRGPGRLRIAWAISDPAGPVGGSRRVHRPRPARG